MIEINEFKQPLNKKINWQPAVNPPRTAMQGEYCRLEPLDVEKHAEKLFASLALDNKGESWTYLNYGPMDLKQFRDWLHLMIATPQSLPYTIIGNTQQKIVGIAIYSNINTAHGTIEVGHLHFSKLLKRTPAATEAMFLMMQRAFDELGYRRYEWKCNALNSPSRNAAERLGFSFEGIFRNHLIVKNRNRDTAWYSIIDSEWPVLKGKFQRWLSADNFNDDGSQKISLGEI
jgi:RimJ/RimL family protein N-acetyltransferase